MRQSTALTYLAVARDRENLTVLADAAVVRAIVEQGCVTGIRLAESAETIRAPEVILCAGSYGSPALLLRAGIGPAKELAGIDVPLT